MLLRRVIEHVKAQNWTAVALDFVIVVVGVFIGIQVSNSNGVRAERRAYHEAIARVIDEAAGNILILDKIDVEHARSLAEASAGLETLQSCVDSEENRTIVNDGVRRIGGTSTIHLQLTALDEITSSPPLLAQQDPETRRRLADAKFRIGVMKVEAEFGEGMPFRDRPETNPILGLGASVTRVWRYHDIGVSRSSIPLVLKAPISEACENDQLLKSFYTWLRFQATLPSLSNAMRAELAKMIAALDGKSRQDGQ